MSLPRAAVILPNNTLNRPTAAVYAFQSWKLIKQPPLNVHSAGVRTSMLIERIELYAGHCLPCLSVALGCLLTLVLPISCHAFLENWACTWLSQDSASKASHLVSCEKFLMSACQLLPFCPPNAAQCIHVALHTPCSLFCTFFWTLQTLHASQVWSDSLDVQPEDLNSTLRWTWTSADNHNVHCRRLSALYGTTRNHASMQVSQLQQTLSLVATP